MSVESRFLSILLCLHVGDSCSDDMSDKSSINGFGHDFSWSGGVKNW